MSKLAKIHAISTVQDYICAVIFCLRGGDMPNAENLIPYRIKSASEAREKGAAGGRASGASRRRKRSMREAADYFLSLPVTDMDVWNQVSIDGVDPEDIDYQMALVSAMTRRAIRGDARCAKVLLEMLGDKADPHWDDDGADGIPVSGAGEREAVLERMMEVLGDGHGAPEEA